MDQVFPIIPASSKAFWTLAVIIVFLVAILGLFGYIAYSARQVRFEVSPAGLKIVGGLYGRTIPLKSLNLAEADRLDLRESPDYTPKWRTNGIGLPGYQAGWFQLANGEKALLFVTDSRRVVRLPTSEGFTVFVSVADTEGFLKSLCAAAAL
jgi:hypothetical protein